jgi:hypothetical protein
MAIVFDFKRQQLSPEQSLLLPALICQGEIVKEGIESKIVPIAAATSN